MIKGSLVSIVVPVYNAEQYLDKLINSVLSQTYEDIELILVNDGSTDRSGEICENYAALDSRVKVYKNDNHGPSYTRNYGIEKSIGTYITFIDSDDYIDTNYIELMVDSIIKDDSDVVFCNQRMEFYRDDQLERFYDLNIDVKALVGDYLKDLHLLYPLAMGPVLKLLKLKLIKEHGIRFPINRSFSEDRILMYDYAKYINKYSYIDIPMYHYCHRDEFSLSKSHKKKAFDDAIFALNYEINTLDNLKPAYSNWMITKSGVFYVQCFALLEDESVFDYFSFLERVRIVRTLLEKRYVAFSMKEKLLALLLKYNIVFPIFLYFGFVKRALMLIRKKLLRFP